MTNIELTPDLTKKIINQLILSDGMEITNKQLIKEKIYYIDNVSLIETLEKQLFQHYFQQIQSTTKQKPSIEDIYKKFSPIYINSDKYYQELLKENTPGIIKDEPINKQTRLTDY